MNRYGERYLTARDFLRHCETLNVKADRHELEHYEKTGVMLPVGRLINPDQYVIEVAQLKPSGNTRLVDTSRWPDLQRLEERLMLVRFPDDYGDLTDDELVHWVDREIDTNRYLTRPGAETYRAWDKYRVQIPDVYDGELSECTAVHYYSYWQVHQLHHIRKFPEFYRNRRLLEHLPNDARKMFGPHPRIAERLTNFEGMHRYFDALSFWMTVYSRIRGRTFATVDEVHGVRKLDPTQANDYQRELETRADSVLTRFNLCSGDLYTFLRQLIRMYDSYVEDERYKLAEDLKSDISHVSSVIGLITGDDIEQVISTLNHQQGRTLRHMDEANKERDYAVSVIKRAAQRCAGDLQERGSSWSFSESGIGELLDYCEDEGLELLRTALSGMLAIGDEEHRFKSRRVARYTNLKGILSSYEYLLKSIGDRGNLTISGTLTSCVEEVMDNESWFQLYKSQKFHNSKTLLFAEDSTEFLDNLDHVLSDAQLENTADGYWARIFLVTLLGRNGTVHFYPDDDRYYGTPFGEILNASVIAILYTWQLAKSEKWI